LQAQQAQQALQVLQAQQALLALRAQPVRLEVMVLQQRLPSEQLLQEPQALLLL
jgi:hypothetical protein